MGNLNIEILQYEPNGTCHIIWRLDKVSVRRSLDLSVYLDADIGAEPEIFDEEGNMLEKTGTHILTYINSLTGTTQEIYDQIVALIIKFKY
jgi:hypothetical protein